MSLDEARSACLHLELPPLTDAIVDATDVSALQLARGVARPLLGHPEAPGYSLAEVSQIEGNMLWMCLRPGLRWSDGQPVQFSEVVAGLQHGLQQQLVLCSLLGVHTDVVVDSERAALGIRVDGEVPSVVRLLCTPHFVARPKRSHGTKPSLSNGAFEIRSRYRMDSAAFTLSFQCEARTQAAVEKFDAGELDATCPLALETARSAGNHPQLSWCESALMGYLLVNQERAPELAAGPVRARIARDWAADWNDHRVVEPRTLAAPDRSLPVSIRQTQVTILYGDYWPNSDIARAVASWLKAAGARGVSARGCSLRELTESVAHGRFDVALVLSCGALGSEYSLAALLASFALCEVQPHMRNDVRRIFQRYLEHGSDELTDLWDIAPSAPVIPLCGFRTPYLARSAFSRLSPLDGIVFPIEQLGQRPQETSLS